MTSQVSKGLTPIRTLLLLLILVAVTWLTYSNHFRNGFHFDDAHTILNNPHIRDTGKIPEFFKDGRTFSVLPQNQSYRPLVSTTLAIDYWLGDGYDPFYFHLDNFLWFLLQGVLLFFIVFHVFERAQSGAMNFYLAAGATLWYMLHPANAETVNYLIARSDIQSTMLVVLAFFLYVYSPLSRRAFLYLIPLFLGALAKPSAVMFAPILMAYLFLFGCGGAQGTTERMPLGKALWRSMVGSLPAFVMAAFAYLFVDHFTPDTWQSGGTSAYHYLITQPFVILHYFGTFFLPTGLSADTDWVALESVMDWRFFVGMAFLLALVGIALVCTRQQRLRPISFGIAWFLLALVPTSSVVPFAEVLNDHRLFFPFIGLAMAVVWGIGLLVSRMAGGKMLRPATGFVIGGVAVLVLAGYAYGAYQRNKVWATEESLWKDVTIKSPLNGRGLMNYGRALMEKGEYATAEKYFMDGLKLRPEYPYLYINLGVLKQLTGDLVAAEGYFLKAIEFGASYPDPWFFYGDFLRVNGRHPEAISKLKECLRLNPGHLQAREVLMAAYEESSEMKLLWQFAEETLEMFPGNAVAMKSLEHRRFLLEAVATAEELAVDHPQPNTYLNLSLAYYQAGDWEGCLRASESALKLAPNSFQAYNNICAAYNHMGRYREAVIAGKRAVELYPSFELARNNLAVALQHEGNRPQLEALVTENASPERFLDLSLAYYQQGNFELCIEACEQALQRKPDYADAYSNICASYNMLGQWEKATEACNAALKIDPQHKLATGNLGWAKDELAKARK